MKGRMALALPAVLLLAGAAAAADMTPKECMARMQNCTACAPMGKYPQLGPNLRFDIFETQSGFVSTFMVADEKMVETFMKCEKECEVTRSAAMKLSDAEARDNLCPFCLGMRALKARDDVVIEEFTGSMGKVTVATGTTDEGIEALHAYAKTARETSALLDKAAQEMMAGKKEKVKPE